LNFETPTNLNLKTSKITTEIPVGRSYSINKYDEFGFEEKEISIDYDIIEVEFIDEIDKALRTLFDNYFKKFKNEIESKAIFTDELLTGYKKIKLKKINELNSFFKNESDIEKNYNNLIIECLEKLYESVSNFHFDEVMISDKLYFKLNKNEIILLFTTMWNKEVISRISQADLYRFLETNILYMNNDSNPSVMQYVKTQANKLKKDVSSTKSRDNLSRIFHKTFFTSDK
jgi:hypothetical protein